MLSIRGERGEEGRWVDGIHEFGGWGGGSATSSSSPNRMKCGHIS